MRQTLRFNQSIQLPRTQSTRRRAQLQVVDASQPSMRNFDAPGPSQNGASPPVASASPSVAPSQEVKNYRISPFDALKFNGPAPERINGRLAMLAIFLIANREMQTGELALQQFLHPDWRVIVGMLLIVQGTMVQVLKGAKDEDFGIFSVRAEKANGRMAMLGVAALIGLEYYSKVPFF